MSPADSTAPAPLGQPATIRVAGAQSPVTADIGTNLAQVLRALDFAAGENAQALLTPRAPSASTPTTSTPSALPLLW
jgi:hypothetical protein